MAPPYLEKVLICMENPVKFYGGIWGGGVFLLKPAGSYLQIQVSHARDLTPQKGREKYQNLLNIGIT